MALIKSPNILHWNQKRNKVVVFLGQNLGQIRSDVVKKVKKQALSKFFFSSYFACGISFKTNISGFTKFWVEIRASIARNATSEGC